MFARRSGGQKRTSDARIGPSSPIELSMDTGEMSTLSAGQSGANSPVLHGWIIPGEGESRRVEWDEIRSWRSDQGLLWADLDRDSPDVERWLQRDVGLSPLVCEALLEEETRPRCTMTTDGLIVILRAVNLNPGATPDDMIAVRCLVQERRVITLRRFRMRAVEDLSSVCEGSEPPRASGALLSGLIRRVISRMLPVVDNLDDLLATLEEEMLVRSEREHMARLSGLRQQVIRMRRYLGPQREVLQHLSLEPNALIGEANRAEIRESYDEITRHIEELDAMRDRAVITHEEVSGRMADQMNRAVYFISIVATIFLPLTVLTGLLGINVGGIPLAESEWGFATVCVVMLLLALGVYLFFRSRRML